MTEAFFCKGCGLSKAVIAGCHLAEEMIPAEVS